MSKRPLLTRRVGLCYVAAAGLQHYGAAGAGPTATASSHDDDIDIVSLGAMQPPLTQQVQASSLRPGRRPRPAEASFEMEESADQTLSRLLQHTFGTLGSALDDNKLDPAGMLPVVDGIDGATVAPTRNRWARERSAEEAPSTVVLEEDEGRQPASLDAAEFGQLAGAVEAAQEAEQEEEEEEEQEEEEEEEQEEEEEEEEEEVEDEEGAEEEEEERGEEEGGEQAMPEGGEQAMPVGTGVPPELGSQQEGAVSTESHSEHGSEVGDAGNGTAAVVAATAGDDVDAGDGCDAIGAAVALEDATEVAPALDDVPAPVRPVDSPAEPGSGDASGTARVEEQKVGDAPAGATASEEVEAFGEGGLGQDGEASTMVFEQVGAFGEGGLGQHDEGGATSLGEVAEALSEGVWGEHGGGDVPATGDPTGPADDIDESGPAVTGDTPLVEDGSIALTADGTGPIEFSPVADAGDTEEITTSGDLGVGALAGAGGADIAGAGKHPVGTNDAGDGSAGQAGPEVPGVPELGVHVEETGVPDGSVEGSLSRDDMVAAAPEIDGQVDALEGEAASPIPDGVQESDAPSEGDLVEVLPGNIIGAVEGAEAAGDRSEPREFVNDVPLAVPLAGTEVIANAETTGEDQEYSAAVGAIEGLDSGEALTGRTNDDDDDTSKVGSSDASAGGSAEKGGAGGGQEEVGHRGGVVEPLGSTEGVRLPEADAAAVGIEPGEGRGVDTGEASGLPLAGVGEELVGSAGDPSETDAPLEGRLRPGEDLGGGGDAPRDATDTPETPPTGSKAGDGVTEGLGLGGEGEEKSPRERRVFRFSEPPGSRADGESAGSPGTPTGVSSDRAKTFTMPPIKPIDVSPEALQKFRVPEESREVARIERTEEWSAWGKRWAGVAMEVTVQGAKVIGGRGGTVANDGLRYCRTRAIKAWHDVVEPRTEQLRQRLETVAIAGLDEVGDHLADPVLAEAI